MEKNKPENSEEIREEAAEAAAEAAEASENAAEAAAEAAEAPAEPQEAPAEPAEAAEPSEAEKLAAELADTQDKYRRLLAEYDNFRKRSAREREGLYQDAAANTVAAMLPVLDNLERALQTETADEAFKKGVEITVRQFYDCLEKLKVKEIPALGEQFDPALHNAVMHVDQEGVDDNTVVEVFQKGFEMNGRVIRHAMVKVAN
jgi:molecular chaperone GrpE